MENVRHYNAFISYRHNPTDSAAASRIQRYLEHFRVPRAIAQKTGKKKIERIFRDKEELPITSDLGDTITMALRESDFLIVICSPRTQESMWVKREIMTFLETHSARQVLTVLVEGEPQDIIPSEILTDNVTGEPLEPLSCDWRLPLRQAKREELPRLAAAILGCAYDELRRRQRQYVMRRVIAGVSLAFAMTLAFGAYMVRTNILIQENYENALRSQSEYLAEESLALLNGGDRLSAILLAMEGLPGPGGDRPLVTHAEYALSSAVGAYEAGTNSKLVALGALIPEGTPKAMEIDQPGRRAILLDDTNTVSVWSITTMERLYTIRPEGTVQKLLAADDSRFYLLLGQSGMICYDTASGEEQWRLDGKLQDAACAQGKVLALFLDDATDQQLLRLLSEEDGSTLFEIKPPVIDGDELLTVCSHVAVSPGGEYIAVGIKRGVSYFGVIPDAWYIVDTGSGQGRLVSLPEKADLHFDQVLTDDGKLITAEFVGDWSAGSLTYQLDREQSLQTGVTSFRIFCLDYDSGRLAWDRQVDSYQITWDEHTLYLLRNGNVAVILANVVEIYDVKTGDVVSRGQMQSSILTCADLLDDRLHVVTEDGGVGQYRYDSQLGMVTRSFQDGLRLARITVVDDGYLRFLTCREGSDEVLIYGAQTVDPGWEEFKDGNPEGTTSTRARRDDKLILTFSDGFVRCWDLTERALLWETDLFTPEDGESDSGRNYDILDWDTRADTVLVWQSETQDVPGRLVTLRASDGAVISGIELPTGVEPKLASINRISAGPGGGAVYGVYFQEADRTMAGVSVYDPERQSATLYPVWEDGRQVVSLWPNGDRALVADEDGGCAMVSLSDWAVTPLEGKLTYESSYSPQEARVCAWSGDGKRVAAAGEEYIYVWSREGELLLSIPWVRPVLSLAFAPDGRLWVMGLDGTLAVFSQDGTEAGRIQCEMYGNPSATMYVEWNFTKGDVYVITGVILTAVDPEAMAVRFTAWQAVTLDEANGRVVSLGENGLMSRPLYTVEELVERGRALTGSLSLTPAQRAAYGLD